MAGQTRRRYLANWVAAPIQLTSFPDVSIEDLIGLQIGTAAAPGTLDFVLDSGPAVTWWKGLELHDAADRVIKRIETQDSNQGPRTMTATADQLRGAHLLIMKAKLFGIHTGMYELHNLDSQVGKELHFSWLDDQDRRGAVAGFFNDVGHGIGIALNAVADAVETVLTAVGDAIADVVQTIGNLFAAALEGIGSLLGSIPGLGPILGGAFHWLATIVSAAFAFIAAWIKAVYDFVGDLIGGVLRIVGGLVGGIFAGDVGMIWNGLTQGALDIFGGLTGAIILILGTYWSFIQAVFLMQLNARPLTSKEEEMLRRVYRGSMSYWNIRVVEGFAGVYSAFYPKRAFTLGTTIYLKDTSAADHDHTLVHECCHAWQYQHYGSRYVSEAIGSQIAGTAYDWQGALNRGVTRWQDMDRESQAEFIEDGWRTFGERATPLPAIAGNGVFYADDPIGNDVEYLVPGISPGAAPVSFTSFAIETITYIRSLTSFRISAFFRG